MEWLAMAIRTYKGRASVVQVHRRVLDLREIDFFGNPLRTKLEIPLAQADRRG